MEQYTDQKFVYTFLKGETPNNYKPRKNQLTEPETFTVTKNKRSKQSEEATLTVKFLTTKNLKESLTLQKAVLDETERDDYMVERDEAQMTQALDGEHGLTVGFFDGDELVAQATLFLDPTKVHPNNKNMSKKLGEKGYEVGAVMAKKAYSGNGLCGKLVDRLYEEAKDRGADYLLYRTEVTNGASFVPALKKNNAFVGHCEVVDMAEYFRQHGSSLDEEKNTKFHCWSVFVPLNNLNTKACFTKQTPSNSSNPRELNKVKPKEYWKKVNKNLQNDKCYLYNKTTKMLELHEFRMKNKQLPPLLY